MKDSIKHYVAGQSGTVSSTLRSRLGCVVLCVFFVVLGVTRSVAADLTVDDFKFDGPLGSEGARIEKLATNHFQVTLSSAPQHPDWANFCQFQILRHAAGNALKLDVRFDHEKPKYTFDHYFHSYSYDGKAWRPIHWREKINGKKNRIEFPAFEQDQVYFGLQVPMTAEDAEAMQRVWAKHPCVKLQVVGQSLGGRNLWRIEITDPASPHPRSARWVHYFKNEHPGEHNAQWRMVGMIDWLLSDEGADFRRRGIFHFVLLMSPDAVSKGWYRVNAQGVDMNRSFRVEGADKDKQPHEAYVFQKDMEQLMASEAPLISAWAMHTWGGLVDPIMTPGPEVGTAVGPKEELVEILKQNDPRPLLKPLHFSGGSGTGTASWNNGAHARFGITTFLCEGASVIETKEENVASGAVIIKSLSQYYRGIKE